MCPAPQIALCFIVAHTVLAGAGATTPPAAEPTRSLFHPSPFTLHSSPTTPPTVVPSPSPAPPSYLLVEGQAYDHIGAGVHKAAVSVTLKATGQEIGTAETNQYGDFAIRDAEQHRGTAIVTIKKQHMKDAIVEVELGTPKGPPFVALEISGAIVLTGTVTDVQTKKPVAGATIRAESGYKDWSATSDDDGSFQVEGLPPGGVELTVSATAYARSKRRIKQTESAEPLEIALSPERVTHLRIVDEAGEPISDVNIGCVDEAANDFRQHATDKDGLATIRELSFESPRLLLRLTHEGYVSSPDFDRVVELPQEEAESTHTLVMRRAGAIVGTVTSADSREPLIGARVSVGEVLSDYSPRAWSEFDGTYRVIGVAPGEAVVTVHLAGHSPSLATVSVEAGKDATMNVTMSPSRTVTGTVVDKDGKPIPEVYVAATKWRDHATLGLRAMTDHTGRFQIHDAPRDAFEIALSAGSFAPLTNQTITAEKSEYAFTLEGGGPGAADGGPRLAVGDEAPAFTIETLEGETIELAKLKGSVVVLDFWATWCGPCVAEIPNLMEVRKSFGDRADFVMISVSLDDDEKTLRSFVAGRKMDWKHARVAAGHVENIANAYHVSYIPDLFVIDKDGKIAATNVQGGEMRDEVARALGVK